MATKGISSLNSVISAMNVCTGKVIDMSILSEYCRCRNNLTYIHDGNCSANYSVCCGAVETEGLLKIF